jgi:hypothetical protein
MGHYFPATSAYEKTVLFTMGMRMKIERQLRRSEQK